MTDEIMNETVSHRPAPELKFSHLFRMPSTSYFLRMIRLLHLLQRVNGYSCLSYQFRHKFQIKVKWFDVLLFFAFLSFHSFLLIYYVSDDINFQNFNTNIFIIGLSALNFLALCGTIQICTLNFLLRKECERIITEIETIDREVSRDNVIKICSIASQIPCCVVVEIVWSQSE